MSKNSKDKVNLFDTNIFLRFITGDKSEYGLKARELFKQAQKGEFKIYLDELVFGEVVWTLQSFYKYSRREIYDNLSKFFDFDFMINPRKKILKRALETYVSTNLSFSDCWIYELSKSKSLELETFDKELQKHFK
jgi:predicted nucleic-acid-binding protein